MIGEEVYRNLRQTSSHLLASSYDENQKNRREKSEKRMLERELLPHRLQDTGHLLAFSVSNKQSSGVIVLHNDI